MIINFDGWYITALVFGILAVLVCFLIYSTKSRFFTLLFKMFFDIFSVLNLAFAYLSTKEPALLAGLGVNVVGVSRDIFFMFRGKYHWANNPFWLFLFVSLYGASLSLTYQNPLSLMPVIASMINTTALYLMNQKQTKVVTIFGQILFITYFSVLISGTELLSILNLLCSVVTLVSVIIGLINIHLSYKKNN